MKAGDRPRLRGVTKPRGISQIERELLWLCSEGFPLRAIARLRGRAYRTVRNELNGIEHRMGVRDELQAVLKAWHEGLIP